MNKRGLNNGPHCTTCGRRPQGIFCALTGGHLLRLDREKVVHEYEHGEIIFYEGTFPAAIYCVYSGTVKLFKTGRKDEEVVIRLLREGEIIGYRALIANEVFAATAQAIGDTTICAITKETLFGLLHDGTDVGMRLMARLATDLRRSEDQMVTRVLDPVPQRTAGFLVWMLEGLPAPTPGQLKINAQLRREEMAHIIGTTPETLSRVLHDFERRRIVDLDRHFIIIRNPRLLRRLADEGTT